jgi:hypothetical protein
LELLFDKQTKLDIELDDGKDLKYLVDLLKTKYLKEREELFVSKETVRYIIF